MFQWNLEFQKHAPAVNVPALFKSLLKNFFAVDRTMHLLHWVSDEGNDITRATDIPTETETLSPIFAGVEIQSRSGIVKGVFKITTRTTFRRIKFHTNIFTWLRDNNIWMRSTSLKSSTNRKIGWFVGSHPTYTNYAQAANKLMDRANNVSTLELTPIAMYGLDPVNVP